MLHPPTHTHMPTPFPPFSRRFLCLSPYIFPSPPSRLFYWHGGPPRSPCCADLLFNFSLAIVPDPALIYLTSCGFLWLSSCLRCLLHHSFCSICLSSEPRAFTAEMSLKSLSFTVTSLVSGFQLTLVRANILKLLTTVSWIFVSTSLSA